MGYSGAQGTLIHEKNFKLKISCQTPLKVYYCTHDLSVILIGARPKIGPRTYLATGRRANHLTKEKQCKYCRMHKTIDHLCIHIHTYLILDTKLQVVYGV